MTARRDISPIMPASRPADLPLTERAVPAEPRRPRPRRPSSLSGQLLLLVAAITLPLLGLAAWAISSAHDAALARAEEALLQRVRALSQAIEHDFDRAAVLIESLAASPALRRGDVGAAEEVMRAASTAFLDAPVTWVSADGVILFSTVWPPGERRVGIPAPDVARRVVSRGVSEVTNLFRAPLTDVMTVAIGTPILAAEATPGGSRPVLGGVGLSLPRDRIAETLRRVTGLTGTDAEHGRVAAIVDRLGVSVARTGREEGIVGGPARPEFLSRLTGAAEQVIHDLPTRDGTPAITAVARGARSGFTYLVAMPAAEFSAPLREQLIRTLGLGFLVLCAGLGVAGLVAHRTVGAFRAVLAPSGPAPATARLREAEELAQLVRETEAQRRLAAAALRESDARFRLVAESAPVMLWMGDPQGRCIYLNRALRDFWGVAPEDIPNFSWVPTIHPDDTAALFEEFGKAMGARAPLVVEARYRRQDGEYRRLRTEAQPRLDADGTFLGMIGVNTDVTDTRRAEAALRASEERLRMAQDAGGIGAWELDLATGMRHWSDSNYRLWGLEPGTPLDLKTIMSLIHPEDHERTRRAVAEAARMIGPLPQLEIRIHRHDDGALRWILSRAESIADAEGRPVRHIGIMRDITAEQEAMERLTLLAREVDHRAKNALAIVQSVVRLTRSEDPDAFVRAVEGRVGALARAHELLARERWSGSDLAAVLSAELEPYQRPQRIHIEPGPPARLAADAVQPFSMVLHELATNAAKYGALSGPEGELRVAWRAEPDGGLRLLWTERGGPEIPGPPTRAGFGQSLIRSMVEARLGGRLEQHWDREGLRCVFTVASEWVAFSTAAAIAPAEEVAAPPETAERSLAGRRVMVVDDEPLIALDLAAELRARGCAVIGPAGRLDQARALAALHAPEAVLLDI
ncbi:MAG TPA: PAS domain-containing protein, partial [Acetobacteraceae bacterium]|nr:PAS domain-containing protein [Acetobacteraceae bacterium]